jgi:nucleotide-binding universal stress UspA family protein
MTGLQTSAERTQASPPNATQWHTGFPFQKIVYVGDVSGADSFGLRYAQKLAHEYQAELVVVHSLDPVVYALPGTALGNPAAEAELTAMDRDPHRHGANHDSYVQREQVCAEILAEARRYSASLIILGSLGRTTAASVALATVARLLMADAPCAILTVPTPAEPTALPRYLWEKVVAATDFSPAGIAALDLAQRIARRGLVALHSTQCGKQQQCQHCMARLRLLAPFNESHTLPVEHLVSSGEVTAALASLAEKMHPDLLVLGAPAIGIESGHLNDSTVYHVIAESRCPVLLVPTGAQGCGQTIDKSTYAWMEKVRCVDGQVPQLESQPDLDHEKASAGVAGADELILPVCQP